MGKKVLVTGGAGFVGRHLCKALLERGDQVFCVDSIVPLTGGICPITFKGWPLYNPFDYHNFHYIKKDCRQYFLERKDRDFEEVFHLAAIVGGRKMIEQNPLAIAEDLSIDSQFWNWVKKVQPGKVVCFSSSAAYPVHYQKKDHYQLLSEDMIQFKEVLGLPDLSYGWAKLTNEYLARLAHEKHGIRVVTYRPFSGYGEDQDLAYPFPSICSRALLEKGQPTFTVWGSGEQMRDFIHIEDCVKGVLQTMNKVNDGKAINLSTGRLTSFKQFAKLVSNAVGWHPKIVGSLKNPEGVFARGGDTQLQESLGFKPNIHLKEGIQLGLIFIEKQIQRNRHAYKGCLSV